MSCKKCNMRKKLRPSEEIPNRYSVHYNIPSID